VSVSKTLAEFVTSTKPTLRQVITTAPAALGPPVYSLRDWMEFAGVDVFAESILPGAERSNVVFLYRPRLRSIFWDFVKHWRLPVFDFLGPAVLGLAMPLGAGWRPSAVVYDVVQAKNAFATSFRDSCKVPEKKRAKDLNARFTENILALPFPVGTPIFVRSAGSRAI
jgi:hypothetical protein